MSRLEADIVIIGGGVGGCACALAACSRGLTVIMTEESDWIGGQFTSQITPPDEHGWIEEFGCTRRYRQFREAVRNHYREHFPLTDEARRDPHLNPGDGWVSPLCAEPKVFLSVLQELLSEFVTNGSLKILLNAVVESADKNHSRLSSVTVRHLGGDATDEIHARWFVDATETGELLPITGTEFVSGAESKAQTGEPNAKEVHQPLNTQAFSMCFAISHHEGEDHTIEKPAGYEFWRDFVPNMEPAWSGRLLSLTGLSPRTMQPVTYNFAPNKEANEAFAGLWTYRRILHRANFVAGTYDSDVTIVNYPQIDYMLGEFSTAVRTGVDPDRTRDVLIFQAKQLSLSFLHYLQTELGFKGLKLRGDITGTADGLAKMPYVRESRRIVAEFTVKEQHVSAGSRPGERFAERFNDSVGIGFYRIDLHPSTGGDNYIDVEALPFQIPLGSLIPIVTENLLPACKNIGTTHITNGCYRLHPVEWNIGESVGELISFCISRDVSPRDVLMDGRLLSEFQEELTAAGIELEWPDDIRLEDGDPHRHAMRTR